MRIPRFYCPISLALNAELELPETVFHHAIQVLRLSQGEALILFNGLDGCDYYATLTQIARRQASALITQVESITRESKLNTTLALALIKPDKMDFALQKAVELGVSCIQPLLTERSVIRVIKDKQDKKLQHWEGIIISACEQSGRTHIPTLLEPKTLDAYLAQETTATRIILAPGNYPRLGTPLNTQAIELIIGPEGGFTEEEVALCQNVGVTALSLGPRILRAETACISALTLIQHHYGDL